jgi:hypothetical protein
MKVSCSAFSQFLPITSPRTGTASDLCEMANRFRSLYEFNHELRHRGDDPSLWTKKLSDSLADFVIDYLEGAMKGIAAQRC